MKKEIKKSLSSESHGDDLIPESIGKGSMSVQNFLFGNPNHYGEFTEKQVKQFYKTQYENRIKMIRDR